MFVCHWLFAGLFHIVSVLCLREACETALKEKHIHDISQMEGFLDESDKSLTSHLEQLETLRRVFREVAEADIPSVVSIWVPLFNGVIFESFDELLPYFVVETVFVRCQTTSVVKSRLIFSVILSSLPAG